MIASWGLLAFLKAADTRQNASFAIRLDRKSEFKDQLSRGGFENPEDIFDAVDGIDGLSSEDLEFRMENDPEFQRFWEEQQAQAREAAERQESAAKAGRRRPKPVQPKENTASQADAYTDTPIPVQPQVTVQPRPQAPAGGPQIQRTSRTPEPAPIAPSAPAGGLDPEGQTFRRRQGQSQPAPRRREADEVRAMSYRNVDDDAFFRSFEEGPQRKINVQTYLDDEGEDSPLTLEDIFGGDDER